MPRSTPFSKADCPSAFLYAQRFQAAAAIQRQPETCPRCPPTQIRYNPPSAKSPPVPCSPTPPRPNAPSNPPANTRGCCSCSPSHGCGRACFRTICGSPANPSSTPPSAKPRSAHGCRCCLASPIFRLPRYTCKPPSCSNACSRRGQPMPIPPPASPACSTPASGSWAAAWRATAFSGGITGAAWCSFSSARQACCPSPTLSTANRCCLQASDWRCGATLLPTAKPFSPPCSSPLPAYF